MSQLRIFDDEERSAAAISDCGIYRYTLTREWDDTKPKLVWCMLNPSDADADKDDPTVRRVRGFTKREERYGGFIVVNVWALRTPDPKELHRKRGAFEPENLVAIKDVVHGRDVVVAWGGSVRDGAGLRNVKRILAESAAAVFCLGYTETGQPRHPLMLQKTTPFERYEL